jgi:hypothetical protein
MRYLLVFAFVIACSQPLYKIEKIDRGGKTLYVRLSDKLVSGSDGACQSAGIVINSIIEDKGEDWKVFVTNDWVPSKRNPIDIGWSRELKKGY